MESKSTLRRIHRKKSGPEDGVFSPRGSGFRCVGIKVGSGAGLAGRQFRDFYGQDVASLAAQARRGVPSSDLVLVSRAMGRPNEYLYRILNFPVATAKRKLKTGEKISPEQSERLIGLQRIIGHVETMMEESGVRGEPFDAPSWVADWLDRPCPALGNKRPADLMDTRMGQEVIEGLLAQMQSGAYA